MSIVLTTISDIPDFQTTMMDSISRDFRKNLLSDCKQSQICLILSEMTNILLKIKAGKISDQIFR